MHNRFYFGTVTTEIILPTGVDVCAFKIIVFTGARTQISDTIRKYVFTEHFCRGQFLNGIKLVGIQYFPSFRVVA